MKTHHDLEVWQRGITFVTQIYHLTNNFPASELYGLTNQIRRAAVSIPSNIAEGAARNTKKDFNHFLAITLGSIAELGTQLIISKNLEFLDSDDFESLNDELVTIRKMTIGLKKSLKI